MRKKEGKKRGKSIGSAWKRELPAVGFAVLVFVISPFCVLAAGGYSTYSPLKVNEFTLVQRRKENKMETAVVYFSTRSNAKPDIKEWNEEEEPSDTEKASRSDTKKAKQ